MPNPIAFSTLGCPAWDLQRTLAAAREYGYDAVELRGYCDTVDLPTAEPFTAARLPETRKRFQDAGVAVCCVSSSGVVTKGNIDHVKAHAEVAAALGCPIVRIFGGAMDAAVPHAQAFASAVTNLRHFANAAQEVGVGVVLETHDSFSVGKRVAELIAAAGHPNVRSLWDLHHPYREGEPIADTQRYLGPTLGHLHVKDSRPDGSYCLMGEGDIPLIEMLDGVLAGGYTGAIALEWEKRWHPEIAEPEVAFEQYGRKLRAYLAAQ